MVHNIQWKLEYCLAIKTNKIGPFVEMWIDLESVIQSEISQKCISISHSVMFDSLQPHGLQPARLLCSWILQARILQWVANPFSKGSSCLQGSSPGLQHCRLILYHLGYQGSPEVSQKVKNKHCILMYVCGI